MYIDPLSDEGIIAWVAEVAARREAESRARMHRLRTISRDHSAAMKRLYDMERLRQQAARLSRKVGYKGITASRFEGETMNQLSNIIHEAQSVLDARSQF
jgi:hypothetical protein